jgi:hypothetical protein
MLCVALEHLEEVGLVLLVKGVAYSVHTHFGGWPTTWPGTEGSGTAAFLLYATLASPGSPRRRPRPPRSSPATCTTATTAPGGGPG